MEGGGEEDDEDEDEEGGEEEGPPPAAVPEEGSHAPITASLDKMCNLTLTSGAAGSIRNRSSKGIN